jgi:hypothetical protein
MHPHLTHSRHALALLVLALPMAANAAPPPPPGALDGRSAQSLHTDTPLIKYMVCAHPFESRGSYTMGVDYSGSGASSDVIPAGKFLEIRSVKANLHGQALSAGNLGVTSGGGFAWYDLRVDNGSIVYSASHDGALYADGNTRIKFVAYRDGGEHRAMTGDYVMRGCLVDTVPPRLTKPDIRLPRLPKKRLTPLEPVETKKLGPMLPRT